MLRPRRGAVCSDRDEAALRAAAGRVSRAAITRCSRHCAARTTATAILARLELGRPLRAMCPSHPSRALLLSHRSSRRLSCLYVISRLLRDPSTPRRPSALWPRATRAGARSQCGLGHPFAASCRPSWWFGSREIAERRLSRREERWASSEFAEGWLSPSVGLIPAVIPGFRLAQLSP